MEQLKPEACYFGPGGGKRTACFVLDMVDASALPSVAEPRFVALDAAIELSPVMSLEDMHRALARVHR